MVNNYEALIYGKINMKHSRMVNNFEALMYGK